MGDWFEPWPYESDIIYINGYVNEEIININLTKEQWDNEEYQDYPNRWIYDSSDNPSAVKRINLRAYYKIEKSDNVIQVHTTEVISSQECEISDIKAIITPSKKLSNHSNAGIYVMPLKNGVVYTEPYLGKNVNGKIVIETGSLTLDGITRNYEPVLSEFDKAEALLLDYYTNMDSGVQQIEITPDKFGGNYYLEASTLFRDTNGVDMPAEFIIPNCKIQSNFTFSMASSGDPSTFTFTMDAFPDYTRFDHTKKVLATIQTFDVSASVDDHREKTPAVTA